MNKKRHLSTVSLYRDDMKFSSGHFTIFSATERERLHGHNFRVESEITAEIKEVGITYDYSLTRKEILVLCRSLNEYLLLPQYSPYLNIEEDHQYYYAFFNGVKMSFLKEDTLILPIKNVTSEGLAGWFVDRLTNDKALLKEREIVKLKIKISTTPGQDASASWEEEMIDA